MDKESSVMRIGTRGSALALAQTRLFTEACRAVDQTFRYEIVEMHTMGDAIQDRPLYEFAGKGMFVSAFEEALADGKIDVAVHSGKDMPVCMAPGLVTGAVLKRGNPGDVLVTVRGREPGDDAVIGTTSLRRRQQVKRYLGYETIPIRGNVITRLQKLWDGEVDGLVLAAAGLERLSLLPREEQGRGKTDSDRDFLQGKYGDWSVAEIRERFVFRFLHREEFLPAAAQGIVAVQCRKDSRFLGLLMQVNDPDTMACFLAERAYLSAVGADCQQPVAAHAVCRNGILHMDAAYWDKGGCFRMHGVSAVDEGTKLGTGLAEKILRERKKKEADSRPAGHVYLVGAGPGRRDLITVRGLELLRRCDVVVYDRLSGEELLAEVRSDCEQIDVGKQTGHGKKQEEINRILIEKAAEGRQVVRLKGGDPFVFGRGGEEAESLKEAGIPFTLVPGVTSAIAVPELAGIPVTHRQISRSFHVITGHTMEGEQADYLRKEIAGLKDTEGTLVFLMGISSLPRICELLLEYGRPPGLPAAVIGSGTRYGERVILGTLSDIEEKVRKERLGPPAVILIGETAALSLKMTTALPLSGVRVGMVGTRHLAEKLGCLLQKAGGETLWMQELLTGEITDQEILPEELADCTWMAFTSVSGVSHFFAQWRKLHRDVRSLAGIRVAAIGSGTAQALEEYGICPDFVPEVYTAAALAQGLVMRLDRQRDRVFLWQAREGNPVLEQTLREAGISVLRKHAYETTAGKCRWMDEAQGLSYLVFGSSFGVSAFCRENPHIFETGELSKVRVFAIGTQTAAALAAAGCEHCRIPERFTAEGLAEAIIADRMALSGEMGKNQKGQWGYEEDEKTSQQ